MLNAKLQGLEAENDEKRFDDARDEAQTRLAEVHARLADMEAESGPARAAALLAGLGFTEADQSRPTKSFSGGWRMRLALARALFVKVLSILVFTVNDNIYLNILSPRCSFWMNLLTTVRSVSITIMHMLLNPSLVDLNALAWLEDYLQTWAGTLLVV